MLLTVIAGVALLVVVPLLVVIGGSAKSIIRPARSRVWTTPLEGAGLPFETIDVRATDGVRIAGWFVPAPVPVTRPAPAVVIAHGWLWNRLGTLANDPINDFPGGKRVELLPFARALHDAGYHVVMFDMRNWGESEGRGVYTGGMHESRDLIGVLDYLATRSDVDVDRIGAVGFSVGGNAILFALPETRLLRAAVAVQPAPVAGFMKRYTRSTFGPLGPVIAGGTELLFRRWGGPPLLTLDPTESASRAGDVPVLYVQGTGDKWGGMDVVERMVAVTPNAPAPVFVETAHRFDGYNHVARNPDVAIAFFRERFGLSAPEVAPQQRPVAT